jgi:hypothetical protein
MYDCAFIPVSAINLDRIGHWRFLGQSRPDMTTSTSLANIPSLSRMIWNASSTTRRVPASITSVLAQEHFAKVNSTSIDFRLGRRSHHACKQTHHRSQALLVGNDVDLRVDLGVDARLDGLGGLAVTAIKERVAGGAAKSLTTLSRRALQ